MKKTKYYDIKKERALKQLADEARKAEEAAKEEQYMEIKNLSQLKKALKDHPFEIIQHCKPDYVGQVRIAQKIQTNGLYSGIYNNPEHEISKANDGKGSWLDFGKAAEWKFEGTLCTLRKYYSVSKTECVLAIKVLKEIPEKKEAEPKTKNNNVKGKSKLEKAMASILESPSGMIVKSDNYYYLTNGAVLMRFGELPPAYKDEIIPEQENGSLGNIVNLFLFSGKYDYIATKISAKEIREEIKNLVGRKRDTVCCKIGDLNAVNARYLAEAAEVFNCKLAYGTTSDSRAPIALFENDDAQSDNIILIWPVNNVNNDAGYWIAL